MKNSFLYFALHFLDMVFFSSLYISMIPHSVSPVAGPPQAQFVLNHPLLMFWRRQWHPTPVLLPWKSHGQRSLEGCSPWGRWGSDTTERLHFHFSLSCTGDNNGNPLQCSCLENPRDGGTWWAAVYGVAQSQTRLKRLSSTYVLVILSGFSCILKKRKSYCLDNCGFVIEPEVR